MMRNKAARDGRQGNLTWEEIVSNLRPFAICSHGKEEVRLFAYTTYGQGILEQLIHVSGASTMSGGKDDGASSLSKIIYAFIKDIVAQAFVVVCPEHFLIVSDPVEIALLNAGPAINNVLLIESSCTKDVDVGGTDVKAIGIIESLGDLF
jgi:hypothetical protein